MSQPTIYLANWSSHKSLHGPGKGLYSIMAQPRSWEHGWGKVGALCPPEAAVPHLRAALIAKHSPKLGGLFDLDESEDEPETNPYQMLVTGHFQKMLTAGKLAPGSLTWHRMDTDTKGPVETDSTCCCACSVADSLAGKCHRAWAAPYLHAAGWQVMQEGSVWEPDSKNPMTRKR